jgi:hypothetical protein
MGWVVVEEVHSDHDAKEPGDFRHGRESSLYRGGGLTTPHKLQAEARIDKPTRTREAGCPLSKPMAEACQLHAVVRPHPEGSDLWINTVGHRYCPWAHSRKRLSRRTPS